MMPLRLIRSPVARMVANGQQRTLSSQGVVAVEKLRGILEEYRQVHYTRELPSRFKKEVVRAAATNDRIVLDGMTRVLANIGAENGLSAKEMKVIFDELGNSAGEIPAHRLVQIL